METGVVGVDGGLGLLGALAFVDYLRRDERDEAHLLACASRTRPRRGIRVLRLERHLQPACGMASRADIRGEENNRALRAGNLEYAVDELLSVVFVSFNGRSSIQRTEGAAVAFRQASNFSQIFGFLGAPQKIRTSDLRLRRPSLYPAELVALALLSSCRSPSRERSRQIHRVLRTVEVPRQDGSRSPSSLARIWMLRDVAQAGRRAKREPLEAKCAATGSRLLGYVAVPRADPPGRPPAPTLRCRAP
jgi:hypothetical protein